MAFLPTGLDVITVSHLELRCHSREGKVGHCWELKRETEGRS